MQSGSARKDGRGSPGEDRRTEKPPRRHVQGTFFPSSKRLPEFYGLRKIHKENAPLRPVVAAFDGPLAPISIFLKRILHQLLIYLPTHIENTAAATRSLEESLSKAEDRQCEQVIGCTMDVVALYPSIPIKDGVEAVLEKLGEHEEEIDTGGLSRTRSNHFFHLFCRTTFSSSARRSIERRKVSLWRTT